MQAIATAYPRLISFELHMYALPFAISSSMYKGKTSAGPAIHIAGHLYYSKQAEVDNPYIIKNDTLISCMFRQVPS